MSASEILLNILECLILPTAFVWLVILAFKRRRIIGFTMIAVYIVLYVILSLHGRYIRESLGGEEYRRLWCPYLLVEPYEALSGRQKTEFTPKGALYWPWIGIDRALWHRDQDPNIYNVVKQSQPQVRSSASGLKATGGNNVDEISPLIQEFAIGRFKATQKSTFSHTFTIQNVSDHVIIIRDVVPDIGCYIVDQTHVVWKPIKLSPGKSIDLKIGLSVQQMPGGFFRKRNEIYTTGRNVPAVVLLLSGEIYQ